MIDYRDIGQRIRIIRLQRKMTQEQLAEATGVGTTHISHVETGNSIPSLQLLVDIINTLDCSADELLCIEVKKADQSMMHGLASWFLIVPVMKSS
jgi:transcriptional regulator with XRE-family HTH domain